MCGACYTYDMAPRRKVLQPIDVAAARLLRGAVAASGRTHADIASEVGMSQNRVSTILRAETPAPTVGELFLIASAIGLDGSALIVAAQKTVSGRPAEPDFYALAANHATGSAEGDELNVLD